MTTALGLEKITNYEVRIYVETANEIFERCFLAAGIHEKRNWPQLLEKAMDKKFSDNPIEAKFLRNKYNTIQKLLLQREPFLEIAFFHFSLLPLAQFAGIDDYMLFNKGYGSLTIPVIYTARPFKLFDFIRIADRGAISPAGGSWVYSGDDGITFGGTLKKVELYTMPGDRQACWIAVTYASGQSEYTIYFAEVSQNGLTVPAQTDRLSAFFSQLLS